jgi:GTP cyclohydrolase IA
MQMELHLVSRLQNKKNGEMVDKAELAYGQFLTALGCDWENDPNSSETPRRIAKKYIFEQWKGRYDSPPAITSFPSDNYDGLITECNIPLVSMCSHHHESILGKVHISYIPGEDGRVIGLSKLNRIVEHFGRRGAIQEQLTMAIHQAVDKVCEGNIGVGVQIVATHQCVSCRGTNHQGASMVTTKLSGNHFTKSEVRNEFFDAIKSAHMIR